MNARWWDAHVYLAWLLVYALNRRGVVSVRPAWLAVSTELEWAARVRYTVEQHAQLLIRSTHSTLCEDSTASIEPICVLCKEREAEVFDERSIDLQHTQQWRCISADACSVDC